MNSKAVFTVVSIFIGGIASSATLMDHEVVLDDQGRLQPWTSYEHVLKGSIEYVKNCRTVKTAHGRDPWYLVTSKLNPDGSFYRNQNNQGSNAYYAVETLRRYNARFDDSGAVLPVRRILDRVLAYHTPTGWAWANVPRTQDDSPDGEYTDDYAEVDKMCMAGIAYLRFARVTSDAKYVEPALNIAKTILAHIKDGDADASPLPFRVKLESGEVLDPYSADMVFGVIFFDELAALGTPERAEYLTVRNKLWNWVLDNPVKTQKWSGYYEDVRKDHENLNQQIPVETARYMIEHFDENPAYEQLIPSLIDWVRDRFGRTRRYGATSIREQDGCFYEMSSHTARFASVVAGWWKICESRNLLAPEKRAELKEEARASFALCTYSTWSKHSERDRSLNYVGLGYIHPWFSDSYFDFIPHLLDGLAIIPEMESARATTN